MLRLLVLVAAWCQYGVLMSNLNYPDGSSRTYEIIWFACLAGYFLTAVVDALTPGLFGSLDELVAHGTALRIGELPEDADLGSWRRRLGRSRLWFACAPFFVFPFIVFGALSADSSRSPHRGLLVWMFTLCGVGLFAAWCVRSARIKRLDSAITERTRRTTAAPRGEATLRSQELWMSGAETPLVGRFLMTAVMSSTPAFAALLLADLDNVVYGDSRASHLGWHALCAVSIAVVAAAIAFHDPRMRVTTATVEAILEYDMAFQMGEIPEQIDAGRWRRWMRHHRRSDAAFLIWAVFLLVVGGWSLVSSPSGYHWAVAILLGSLAAWLVRRWRALNARHRWLRARIERHVIAQMFG